MNFHQEPQRLAEQGSRREWAADAVHTALAHPAMKQMRRDWRQGPSSPVLAVVNIPTWPMADHLPAAVRFLDLGQLQQGQPQWLGTRGALQCPLEGTMPQDSTVFGILQHPYLKILCLTPKGWANCYNLSVTIPDDQDWAPALNCIETTFRKHKLPFKGMIITTPDALSL